VHTSAECKAISIRASWIVHLLHLRSCAASAPWSVLQQPCNTRLSPHAAVSGGGQPKSRIA
jgi:hypothetical protein